MYSGQKSQVFSKRIDNTKINYIFPLKSEKSGIKTFIKCIFYLWNEIAIPLFDVTLQTLISYSSTPLNRAQDCGIVVLDNKNKARWVLLNILAKKTKIRTL